MERFHGCFALLIAVTLIDNTAQYKPIFMVHGVLETAESSFSTLVGWINQAHPGTIIHNSNAYPLLSSTIPLPTQIRGDLGQEFLNFSRTYTDGFHLIGFSQGGLLARALVETYDEHNVLNFISISGPLAGVYGIGPRTLKNFFTLTPLQAMMSLFYYDPAVQRSNSISNYWNDPNQHTMYLSNSVFLPYIDNELQSNMSETYKRGFTKLKNHVCICGPDDYIIFPWQSCHYSFIDGNQVDINYKDRDLYKKDSFGLRTLDESGRFHVFEKKGVQHLEWTRDSEVFHKYILPFLD